MKRAFTLLEVIIVITVVLTLLFFLSSKFVDVNSYSSLSSAKATYAMVKNAISQTKTSLVLKGQNSLVNLDSAAINQEKQELFSKVLKQPIISSQSGWMKASGNSYYVVLENKRVYFEYKDGFFSCIDTNKICKELE